MDWADFWKILQSAYRSNGLDHVDALVGELSRLKWFEVVAFQQRFMEATSAANTLSMWAAAYLIQGGCTDEGFRDFRAWLVGRGERVYDAALLNPDSLAEILDGDPVDSFGLEKAAVRAYESLTGMSDFYERLDRLPSEAPLSPEGEDWDFEDQAEMQLRFPNLSRLYPPPTDDE